jgi:4-amino-4-deoxy-L-arabinose transferase-like glycosyltransferase
MGGAVLGCALFLVLQAWLIHAGSRDYDEGVYWQSVRAMVRGEPLFQSVFASQPPAFYYALLPLYLVSHTLAALRITVLLFAIVGLGAAYVAGRLLAGPLAGLVALLLLASSVIYIHEAVVLQADAPAVAMMLVAIALTIAATREGARRARALAALAGLAFALALGIKLLGAVALVPILLCFFLPRRQPIRMLAWWAAGLVGGLVLVLLPTIASPGAAFEQLVTSHLAAGQATHGNLRGNLGLLIQLRQFPLDGLALLGAAIALWRRDFRILVPLGWTIASLIAILVYHPLFPHHLVLLPPALALTAAVGFADVALWRPVWTPVATAAVLAAGAIGLTVGVRDTQRGLIPNGHDRGVAAAIRAASKPGDFIISDNPFAVALANRDIPGPIVDTSHQRAEAGQLTVADLDSAKDYYGAKLVVTDGGRLQSVPGFSDWLSAHFRQIGTVGKNAALYEALQETD